MNKLYFLIGASGAGKTTAAKSLAEKRADVAFCYSDSIGVPTPEEMIRDYGSGEEWQRANTIKWVGIMKERYLPTKITVLDSQTRPSFIKEACELNGIENFDIILFDCSDDIRTQRLHVREQPELADERMMNWAKFLREESNGFTILDNSGLSKEETVEALDKLIM